MSYLSPEPLLQNPNWVAFELQGGHHVPSYSYAGNNPISNIDPDGLYKRQLFTILRPLIRYLPPTVVTVLDQPIFPWEASPLGDGTLNYTPGPSPTPPAPPAPPVCGPGGGGGGRCTSAFINEVERQAAVMAAMSCAHLPSEQVVPCYRNYFAAWCDLMRECTGHLPGPVSLQSHPNGVWCQ
jgi:hypothetical protein